MIAKLQELLNDSNIKNHFHKKSDGGEISIDEHDLVDIRIASFKGQLHAVVNHYKNYEDDFGTRSPKILLHEVNLPTIVKFVKEAIAG